MACSEVSKCIPTSSRAVRLLGHHQPHSGLTPPAFAISGSRDLLVLVVGGPHREVLAGEVGRPQHRRDRVVGRPGAARCTPASEVSESALPRATAAAVGEVAGAVRHQHELLVGQHRDVLLHGREVGRERRDQVGDPDPGAARRRSRRAGAVVAEPAQRPLDAGACRRRRRAGARPPDPAGTARAPPTARPGERSRTASPSATVDSATPERRGQVAVVGPAQEPCHLPGPGTRGPSDVPRPAHGPPAQSVYVVRSVEGGSVSSASW